MNSLTIWKTAQILYEQLVHLDPDEQAKRLQHSTVSNEVMQTVKTLLNAREVGTQAVFSPALNQLPNVLDQITSDALQDIRFGPYTLRQKIGEGGMGEVFLAQRDDGVFDKQVVIKLIHCGILSAELRQRFQRERQILADLEHPNIAHLIDGGEADEQLLFVVMEYVQGDAIHQYCGKHQLSVHQRIHLFLKLCNAVQYAHQKLIIHCDIKPENILINEHGEPKLLDFGIATLLEKDSKNANQSINYPQAFTPIYASPEQIMEQPTSIATDIYALGVLLHELLCGQRPFSAFEEQREVLENAICEKQAQDLSQTLSQIIDSGGGEPIILKGIGHRHAVGQVKGDIDHIVAKALNSDPSLRYSTVLAFQQDLEAYLSNWPISARVPRLSYRIKKYIARHKLPLFIAMSSSAAIIAFIVFILFQSAQLRKDRDFALQEQNRAEAVTNLLLNSYESADPTITAAEAQSMRRVLDRALNDIDDTLSGQPEVQSQLKLKIAWIYRNLNVFDTAETLATESLSFFDGFDKIDPFELADNHYLLADIYWQKAEATIALEHIEKALALLKQEPQNTNKNDPGLILDYQLFKARIIRTSQGTPVAVSMMQDTLAGYIKLYDLSHPKIISNQIYLATALDQGYASEEAEALFRQALTSQRKTQSQDNHITADILNKLGGTLYHLNKLLEAQQYVREALSIRRKIFDENHLEVAYSLVLLGQIDFDLKAFDEAIKHYQDCLTILKGLLGESDIRYASVQFSFGQSLLKHHHDLDLARVHLTQAVEIGQAHYSTAHYNMGGFYFELGNYYLTTQQLDLAIDQYHKSIANFFPKPETGVGAGNAAQVESKLAYAHFLKGNKALSIDMLTEAVPVLKERFGVSDNSYIEALELLKTLQLSQ